MAMTVLATLNLFSRGTQSGEGIAALQSASAEGALPVGHVLECGDISPLSEFGFITKTQSK